jgi:hypothetical protein
MFSIIAHVLAVLLNITIIVIGVRFLIAPRTAAAGYGITASPAGDSTYLTVKGVRDTVIGLLGLAVLALGGQLVAGVFMVIVALAPIGDAFIVARGGGPRSTVLGVHAATAVVLLISAALLLLI